MLKELFAVYLRPHKRSVIKGLFYVTGSVLLALTSPYISRLLIDDFVAGDFTMRRVALLSVVFLMLSAAGSGMALLMRRTLLKIGCDIEATIRNDMFACLMRQDLYFYNRERTGDIMTRMTSDLYAVRELMGQGLLQVGRIVIGFAMAFAVMFYIDALMAAVMMLLVPCSSLIFFAVIRVVRARYERMQETFSDLSNHAQESFAGIRTIKGFAAEPRLEATYGDLLERYKRRALHLSTLDRAMWPLMSLLYAFGFVCMLLIGGHQIINGEMRLGVFVQFTQYLMIFQWPMISMGWVMNLYQRGTASWQRIQRVLKAAPEIVDAGGERVDFSGQVRFERVQLHMGERTLLEDIDIDIPAGSTVGITGPTGSGKTLLCNLMARLMDPTAGRISMDGHDVRDISLPYLRRQIGFAPQEPFLFSHTLEHNIGFGLTEDEPERVVWAAEVAQLKSEVDVFPEGFATMLGERGVTLSGGQRQRTAISRAIARRPTILLLDDVFSAIDTHTEAELLQQLVPVMNDLTTVIVSHRTTTLRHADMILVLENGRITDRGRHDELVARDGYYRALDERQRLESSLEEDV